MSKKKGLDLFNFNLILQFCYGFNDRVAMKRGI